MNTASQEANRQPDSAQDQLKQLIAYKQKLIALMEETQNNTQVLSSEMKLQQTMVATALSIEGTNRDRLKKEQELLNQLEEENKAALLELAYAKQKSVQAMRRYNEQLENIKHLHSHLEQDTEASQTQQQNIKQLIANWQSSSFFLQKQQNLEQEINERIAALRAHINQNTSQAPPLDFDSQLPQLAELTAPAPSPAAAPAAASSASPAKPASQVNSDIAPQITPDPPKTPEQEAATQAAQNAEHANANFWDRERRAAIRPKPIAQTDQDQEPDNEPEETEKPRKSVGRIIGSYLKCIALAVLFAFIIRTWVLVPTQVSGSSMQPTLDSNDKVLTSPLPYLWGSPQRGDVVVFQAPNEPDGVYYVKRVIALPGEHLQIMDGQVYVDDKLLDEPYVGDGYTNGYVDTLVPSGTFFVMGDNREVSHDSRDSDVSFIDSSRICGQALWRIYPFDSFGSIK